MIAGFRFTKSTAISTRLEAIVRSSHHHRLVIRYENQMTKIDNKTGSMALKREGRNGRLASLFTEESIILR